MNVDEVLGHYKTTRSPFKTANALKMNVEEVWRVIEDNRDLICDHRIRFEGLGRPELQKFIVARKTGAGLWDNSIPEVARARRDYEAGIIDMATGRDGPFLILYAIPRKKKQPRPNFWSLANV